MVIRVGRTGLGQDPQRGQQQPGRIEVGTVVQNPAATAVRPASQAADLAEQLYREDRDREIETRVRELDIARRELDNGVVDQYLQAFGKNAVDARGPAMEAIRANSRQVLGGIKDRTVREVWAGRDAALTHANIGQIDAHYRQQSTRWQDETMQERSALLQDGTRRAALGDGYDPASGRLSLDAQRNRSAYHAEIDARGKLRGWDAATVANMKMAADTQALGGVVEDLVVQGRAAEANAFLGAHNDRIEPGRANDLRGQVARGLAFEQKKAVNDAGARVSDDLVRAFSRTDSTGVALLDTDGAYGTLEDEYSAGRMSLEVRDDAEKRLDRIVERQKKQRDAAVNKVVADAEAMLTANPGLDPNDLPGRLLAPLTEHGKLPNLIAFANNGRHINRASALEDLARDESDGTLQQLDASAFRNKYGVRLDNQTFERWDGKRASMRNEANSKQLHLRSLMDDVEGVLVEAKMLPDPGLPGLQGKANAEQLAWKERFITVLQAKIDAEKITDRAKVLEEAKKMAANRAFVDFTNVFGANDTEVPLDAMSKEERTGAYVETSAGVRRVVSIEGIDPKVLAAIDQDLRTGGKQVTEAARLERYVSVYEPRRQALERIEGMPEAEWHRAIKALQERHGDHKNPIEIEREMQRLRDEDLQADMKRRSVPTGKPDTSFRYGGYSDPNAKPSPFRYRDR